MLLHGAADHTGSVPLDHIRRSTPMWPAWSVGRASLRAVRTIRGRPLHLATAARIGNGLAAAGRFRWRVLFRSVDRSRARGFRSTDQPVTSGFQLPTQPRKRFREGLLQPDEVSAYPVDHLWPVLHVVTVAWMRKANSACLQVVHTSPSEFITETTLQFLLLLFELIENPFVPGRIRALEIQLHTRFALAEDEGVVATGHTCTATQPVVL